MSMKVLICNEKLNVNINMYLQSANEGCFYKTMDWVKGNQVQPSVIEVLLFIKFMLFPELQILPCCQKHPQADMAGLPGFDSFKDDINSCSAWY